MRVLALQPYDAGAHRAFLAGWQTHSRHAFTVLSLPGRHFKWRMRQAPVHFAREVQTLAAQGLAWDALWCTSMLDLATLRGMSGPAQRLPAVVYFHENQLAYPSRYPGPRDIHFGLTNMTTALASIASHPGGDRPCVWWNSGYNRDSFLDALGELLGQMPDHPPLHAVDTIRQRSAVHYPGIDLIRPTPRQTDRPPILLWAARWEHDKAPELFFEALDELDRRGVGYRLSVVGEQFAEYPKCFDAARERFADRIVRWGYQPTRVDYEQALREADIVISTARHEFFGLAIAEAISAGCVPVLPDALAYPEVWGDAAVYHDNSPGAIADAIERAMTVGTAAGHESLADRFAWPDVAARLDDAIEACALAG